MLEWSEFKKKINELDASIRFKDSQITALQKNNEKLEKTANDYEKTSRQYRQLRDEIEKMTQEKSTLRNQFNAIKEVAGLSTKIGLFVKNELAPIKYANYIQYVKTEPIVAKNITETIDIVQTWIDEMRSIVYNTNIIDVEEYEYE